MAVPMTKRNSSRWIVNIIGGIPMVTSILVGTLFYKEEFKSHSFAFELLDKYGVQPPSEHDEEII